MCVDSHSSALQPLSDITYHVGGVDFRIFLVFLSMSITRNIHVHKVLSVITSQIMSSYHAQVKYTSDTFVEIQKQDSYAICWCRTTVYLQLFCDETFKQKVILCIVNIYLRTYLSILHGLLCSYFPLNSSVQWFHSLIYAIHVFALFSLFSSRVWKNF